MSQDYLLKDLQEAIPAKIDLESSFSLFSSRYFSHQGGQCQQPTAKAGGLVIPNFVAPN